MWVLALKSGSFRRAASSLTELSLQPLFSFSFSIRIVCVVTLNQGPKHWQENQKCLPSEVKGNTRDYRINTKLKKAAKLEHQTYWKRTTKP